jgi:hypothetical protein
VKVKRDERLYAPGDEGYALAALGQSKRLLAIVTDEDLDGYASQRQTTSPSRPLRNDQPNTCLGMNFGLAP